MIVHKYTVPNYDGRLDQFTGKVAPRTRLYVPDSGVLSYVGRTIEFFSQELIGEAERVIRGEVKQGERYLGKIDINASLEGMAYFGNLKFRDHVPTMDVTRLFDEFASQVIDEVEHREKSTVPV